ncbi:MAG: hypothetical protein JW798_03125 [Prolixibacteraceae bacterium]|nr:hypothetical protein [Prolixibacteraceae bacterium]
MQASTIKKSILHRVKTKGKLTFISFLLIGLFVGAFIHVSHSCISSFDYEHDEEKIDNRGIKNGASEIESAFSNADTLALANLLTATSLEIYSDAFPEIQAYMPQYAEAFKSRKLIFANEIFAVYEFVADGITYTLEMTIGDDGNWKLVRF